MTSNQERIKKLIDETINFCIKLEKQNEGLTIQFMNSELYRQTRGKEETINELFEKDDYLNAAMIAISIRQDWMMAINRFKGELL